MSQTAQFYYPTSEKLMHLVVMVGELLLHVYKSFCIL